MKTKKGLIRSFIFLLLFGVIFIFFYTYFSENNIKGRRNSNNIQKIKIGMTMNAVKSIMDEPDSSYIIDDKKSKYRGNKSYYYSTGNNPGRFEVIFDKNVDSVIYIHISFK